MSLSDHQSSLPPKLLPIKPMSDSMTATTDQWMQFYQQSLMDGPDPAPDAGGFSDATLVTTSPTMSSEAMSLSANSSSPASGQLTTKGNLSRPIRRRTRASKRNPTTLLNANTTNFRALVQQFTGCPTTSLSSGFHNGPITLNFQQGGHIQFHHNRSTTLQAPLIGNNNGYNRAHNVADGLLAQPKQLNTNQQFQQVRYQQHGDSFDHYMKSNTFASSLDSSGPSMEVSDGLLLDNDISLQELSTDAFSNDDCLM